MIIKELIQKVIPSYRMGHSILKYCESFTNEFVNINKRIDDLDNKNEYLFWFTQKLSGETDFETRKRIFAEMPKATGELRDIQNAENYLLKRIKKHTDELNINFFLMGGTALGAVRHRGFIPWDDDIDIGMLQEDYKLLKKRIDADDGLISVNRFFNSNGGSVVKAKFNCSENIYIDIFTFDMIDVGSSEILDFWRSSQIITQKYTSMISKKYYELGLDKYSLTIPIYSEMLDVYSNNLLQELESGLSINGTKGEYITESIANGSYFRNSRMYWKRDDVFPFLVDEAEFEGNTYCMINKYEKRLEAFFGDIWCFPKTITSHHNNEFNNQLAEDLKRLKKMRII